MVLAPQVFGWSSYGTLGGSLGRVVIYRRAVLQSELQPLTAVYAQTCKPAFT